MFKRFNLLIVLLVWMLPMVSAQTAALTGSIDEILVEGSDNALELQGLIKVSLNISVGDPLTSLNVDEVKQQLLELGYFKTVNVVTRKDADKNVIVIRVELNPRIATIEFKGNTFAPSDRLRVLLDQQLNVAVGTIVNNGKLEEARVALQQAYRQTLPFTPDIQLEQAANTDGTAKITYVISETAAIKSVQIMGATLVPTKDIEVSFAALVQKGLFDAALYEQAFRQVLATYNKLGYRGSGVNFAATSLEDGKLTVAITELKVVALDATALSLDPDKISLKVGDFFNYDTLLSDLQSLAKDRPNQVQLKVDQVSEDTVAVTLFSGDAPAGPIKEIKIIGNTVLSNDQILNVIRQKVGDTYNAQIATEIDFSAITAAYDSAGYLIINQPRMTYADGIYTIVVLEQKVIAYDLQWKGDHRTQNFVVTREFPTAGTLFFRPALQRAFGRVQQLGILKDLKLNGRVPDNSKPEELILILELEEGSSGSFLPSIGYNSLSGWDGSLSYNESNLWGVNHVVRVQLQASPNNAGQVLSGNVSYSIPWLYVDFLDFQTVPTALNFSVFTSIARSGEKLTNPYTVATNKTDTEFNEATEPRLYTVRNTGFSLGVRRPIGPHFSVSFSTGLSYETNTLETRGDAKYTNAEQQAATAALPVDSLTVYSEIGSTYSTKNRDDFPTSGVVFSNALGYGFGSQGSTPLSWTRFTIGARGYLGFGWDEKGEFGLGENRNIAFATRFSTGVILGNAPSTSQFAVGDVPTGNEDFALRGYSFGDLRGNAYYSGSFELRYDLGLKTSFTYGALAMVFLDYGNAWGGLTPSPGLQLGYGLGVQLNIGVGGLQLPPLGFFYAFSQRNPSGKFHFAFGFRF